jgi:uncharacterized protein YbbC (DUF1343 family)
MVEIGLEIFLKKEYRRFKKLRLGVLCNQASVDSKLQHVSEIILKSKLDLKISGFFGPQHGIRGEKQDNMVESDDFIDPASGLPVHSLYGKSREPSESALPTIDAFVIDLQDIGTRIYTFMYTMANCMRAAKKFDKKVIVLDRPNPIGGLQCEGNVLESGMTSFVGQYPLCTRHGMTMGELALMFNEEFGIGCDLEVIRIKGWSRKQMGLDWKRDWVAPSPNIPRFISALTFPGCVHFEGTNISEGRGTTFPFEWIGAPYINPDALAREMNLMRMPGVYFRPIFFQPTYQKCKDTVCGGVQIHVLNIKQFQPFLAGVRLLNKIAELFPKGFKWKNPPYEYEHERMPIDLIAGTSALRNAIDSKSGLKSFEDKASKELSEFKKLRKKYLLYRER